MPDDNDRSADPLDRTVIRHNREGDEYGDEWAMEEGRYMHFKRDVIALFDPNMGFTLASEDIARWRSMMVADGY